MIHTEEALEGRNKYVRPSGLEVVPAADQGRTENGGEPQSSWEEG